MTPTITDWIGALVGFVGASTAVYAAIVGLRTFQHQRTARDVELALAIFAEINRYWDKIDEKVGNQSFNFGQILAQFEVAAALFNDDILTEQADKILKDHIVEVLTSLQSSDHGRALLEHCKSSKSTFEELKKFGTRHFPQALLTQMFADAKQIGDASHV